MSHFFFKIENAVTESERLSEIDENVCILHDNIYNMFLGINEKYETVYIYYCLIQAVINKITEIFNPRLKDKLNLLCFNQSI